MWVTSSQVIIGRAYSSYNETKRQTGADDKKWSINRLAKETIDNLKPFVIYALNWMNFGLWTKYQTLGSSQLGYNQGTFNFGRADGFYSSTMSIDLLLLSLVHRPSVRHLTPLFVPTYSFRDETCWATLDVYYFSKVNKPACLPWAVHCAFQLLSLSRLSPSNLR